MKWHINWKARSVWSKLAVLLSHPMLYLLRLLLSQGGAYVSCPASCTCSCWFLKPLVIYLLSFPIQIPITQNTQFYSHLLSQASVIFCYGKNFQFPILNWTLFVHCFTGDTLLCTFYFSYLCACLTALNFMFYWCHFSCRFNYTMASKSGFISTCLLVT